MSLLANFHYIAKTAPTLQAIVLWHPGGHEHLGDESLFEFAPPLFDLLERSCERKVRAVVGTTTFNAFRFDDERLLIAFPTGDNVAKSIDRLVTRSAAREAPPDQMPRPKRTPKAQPEKVYAERPFTPPVVREPTVSTPIGEPIKVDYERPLPTEPTRPF